MPLELYGSRSYYTLSHIEDKFSDGGSFPEFFMTQKPFEHISELVNPSEEHVEQMLTKRKRSSKFTNSIFFDNELPENKVL